MTAPAHGAGKSNAGAGAPPGRAGSAGNGSGCAVFGGWKHEPGKGPSQCPFYLEHNLQSIVCEGALPGSQLRTEFGKTMECSGHVAVFCTSEGLHPCSPIYGMLMEKYEKGGKGWQSD